MSVITPMTSMPPKPLNRRSTPPAPGEHRIPGVMGWQGHAEFSWSHTDPTYDGPHIRYPNRMFAPPISTYAGHKPINWNPHSRKHMDPRSKSVPLSRSLKLPRAASTANAGEPGLWFGTISQFPKDGK
eukprot:TRINITY_DN32988_c0_g1_i1.p1 TRINITY_DN32988_c0_g1~~TRINITY_DN32988_c0_g1_i1.p1  ORF type:complete len:128 (+),score=0.31 TRINITY_DN32988_c0_g1_i1:82-465(+)